MTGSFDELDYKSRLAAESKKWGEHLKVEASGQWNAWIDHPLVLQHYQQRGLINGISWEHWVKKQFGGPAERSLDLGCGAGHKSIAVFNAEASRRIDGVDVSEDRIAAAEQLRQKIGAPGSFRVADTNTLKLPADTFDLIFSCHSFHHFFELEHIMEQVHKALTPRGLFILEEFVGPTQFQWTGVQIDLVRSLIPLVPERLRRFRWGAIKTWEGRATPAEVVAVSPFESIRSAQIFPLFKLYFEVVIVKQLGGTIQHLLYNGIIHHFDPTNDEAVRCIKGICAVEDALVDSGMLPSDFMLLIGKKKGNFHNT